MAIAEREFLQKKQVWESAVPKGFAPQVEALTNKTRVLGDLIADGPIKFISDSQAVFRDFYKAIGERRALRSDPIYNGEGYPHGGQKKVIGVGGMGSDSWQYWEIIRPLRRLGHDASMLPWVRNMESPRQMGRVVLNHLRQEVKGTGKKAAMFGHSLGTFQIMGAFSEDPEEFASYVDKVYADESAVPGELNTVLKVGSLLIPFSREDVNAGESLETLRKMEAAGIISLVAIESSDDHLLRGSTIAGSEANHYIMGGRSHIGAGASDFVKILSFNLVGEEVDFNRVPTVHHAPVTLAA